LLVSNVLGLKDIAEHGEALETFLWLPVLFALSGQLNELGFIRRPAAGVLHPDRVAGDDEALRRITSARAAVADMSAERGERGIEDNRYDRRHLFCRGGPGSRADDDIDFEPNELGGDFGEALAATFCLPPPTSGPTA
jgi:hypothetical protein